MKIDLTIDGQTRQVQIEPAPDDSNAPAASRWRILIDGEAVHADACFLRPGILSLLMDGRSHRVILDSSHADPILHFGQHRIEYQADDPRSLRRQRRHAAADGPVNLKSSMPGRVIRILAQPGEAVAAHQGIVVVEAMKMQNELKSPRAGRLAQLRVAPGDTVASGQILAMIE